jgi:hypothetical protein
VAARKPLTHSHEPGAPHLPGRMGASVIGHGGGTSCRLRLKTTLSSLLPAPQREIDPGHHFLFPRRTIVIIRRIASDLSGWSGWLAAQSSISARISSDRRIAMTGSRLSTPVNGRPRFFFGITTFFVARFVIKWYYQECGLMASANSPPALTKTDTGDVHHGYRECNRPPETT